MSATASSPVSPAPGLPAEAMVKTGAPLTKKMLVADHPTWCPGCGDFAVLDATVGVARKSALAKS